ncbi:hypothetical protein GCM10010324_35740 [Streptomyces hiroshimensis]|uniref:Uncharacterized protein n=1 Tax=Streptomyces hiroshimensis TaxID=66424 RepID=A0ABQ2YK71_9ACTN|nr:hypothetical protein GCM10010324_35740 [Streptomyces hiroshimensis]
MSTNCSATVSFGMKPSSRIASRRVAAARAGVRPGPSASAPINPQNTCLCIPGAESPCITGAGRKKAGEAGLLPPVHRALKEVLGRAGGTPLHMPFTG